MLFKDKTRVSQAPTETSWCGVLKTTTLLISLLIDWYRILFRIITPKQCFCHITSRVVLVLLKMSPPTLILGAGFLGVNFATPSELQLLLELVQKERYRIDTARRYPAINSGRSEQLLGEVGAASQGFAIDTEIKVVGSDASGSLMAAKIKEAILERPEVLRVTAVGLEQRREWWAWGRRCGNWARERRLRLEVQFP